METRFRTTKSRALLALLALVALGVGWQVWQGRSSSVPYTVADSIMVQPTLRASGIVVPETTVTLRTSTVGLVHTVHVDQGDVVTAGEALLALDAKDVDAQIRLAEAQMHQAQAIVSEARGHLRRAMVECELAATRIENAQRLTTASARDQVTLAESQAAIALEDLDRVQRLVAGGGSSKLELQRAHERNELAQQELALALSRVADAEVSITNNVQEARVFQLQAEAAVRVAEDAVAVAESAYAVSEAAYHAARVGRDAYEVLAPVCGTVLSKDIERGEYVQPGQSVFVVGTNTLFVRIEPDERELPSVRVGQSVVISPEAYPQDRIDGHVAKLGPRVDAGRGTIEILCAFDHPYPKAIPNMAVSVAITADDLQELVLVPEDYLELSQGRYRAFVYKEGRAEQRTVVVNRVASEGIVVSAGIQPGDFLLRPHRLNDGQAIRLGDRL